MYVPPQGQHHRIQRERCLPGFVQFLPIVRYFRVLGVADGDRHPPYVTRGFRLVESLLPPRNNGIVEGRLDTDPYPTRITVREQLNDESCSIIASHTPSSRRLNVRWPAHVIEC